MALPARWRSCGLCPGALAGFLMVRLSPFVDDEYQLTFGKAQIKRHSSRVFPQPASRSKLRANSASSANPASSAAA